MTGRKDLYEEVTRSVIDALEAGTVPWHQPWKAPGDMPASLSTGKPYRGVNTFLLTMTSQARGYSSRWWGTYKQIGERGGQVRKGEKSTSIVFWKFLQKVNDDGSPVIGRNGKPEQVPMLRSFNVFNADQQDGATIPATPEPSMIEPNVLAEKVAADYIGRGPTFSTGGDRAYYSPGADLVRVPDAGYFVSADAYYSTLFHELTHSTGHKSRLARADLLEHHYFGDESYSREELTAEMGAAMLCASVGIEQVTVPQTAAYIASWLRVLKADARAVIVAAGHAQKAADLIHGDLDA